MTSPENGIARLASRYSVDETVSRIEAILREKGIRLFVVVDHSGGAERAGLTMPPTKLVIFGNPKAGTPLMLETPSAALDLPLKLLVSQQPDGSVWISYNTPAYLQQRHGFSPALVANIAAVELIAAAAGGPAA
jgi:uncharacterized protein (DUF302 family)